MTEEQAVELLEHAQTVEGLLVLICAIMIVAMVYRMFKACLNFLDMFFN